MGVLEAEHIGLEIRAGQLDGRGAGCQRDIVDLQGLVEVGSQIAELHEKIRRARGEFLGVGADFLFDRGQHFRPAAGGADLQLDTVAGGAEHLEAEHMDVILIANQDANGLFGNPNIRRRGAAGD